jgi:formate/nitrite transporter FocA (FNT family)
LMSASRPIYLLAIVFINIPIFIKDKVHESLYKVIQIICSIIAIVIIGYGFYITNN